MMILTLKSVALYFGDYPLSRVGTARVYVIDTMLIVLPYFHIAVFRPQVIIKKGHTAQSGNRLGLAVGCNPSLRNLGNVILGFLSNLEVGFDEEKADYLVLLAGRYDGVIFVIPEHPLACVQYLQLHTAMGTPASANGICKAVFLFPRMPTFGAVDDAFCTPAPIMFETMPIGVCLLLLGYLWQSLAQSCNFFL